MKQNNKKKLYFIAGEASGDLHGAALIKHIKSIDNNSFFYGIGGDHMVAEGLQSLVPIKQISVMGFVEVFMRLPFFLNLFNKVLKNIREINPSKIILIDYPGFNLKLAKKIKQQSDIDIIYYISPQLWAWKENRLQYIKKYIDKLIVLFPFEKRWYKNRGINVAFFGHPLVENYMIRNKASNINTYQIATNKYIIALFPGSRKQEIKLHAPVLKQTILKLQKSCSNLHFVIRLSSNVDFDIKKDLGLLKNYTVEKHSSFVAFSAANFAIVASGTATLECAASNTPFVVIYKTSFVSWVITKTFIRVPYASIVNILSQKEVVKEFLQDNASADKLVPYILDHINSKQTVDYSKMIASLAYKNTYYNTAQYIFNFHND